MGDKHKGSSVSVEVPAAKPLTDAARRQDAINRDLRDYHSQPLPNLDVVTERGQLSNYFTDKNTVTYTDGRGNKATMTRNMETRQDDPSTLTCSDGRRLSSEAAERAMNAVRKDGRADEGWFSTDYTFDHQLSPLEQTCRADHNAKKHGGRDPSAR